MRIQYLVPGPMRRAHPGEHDELARREKLLRGWAAPDTEVRALDSTDGPLSIESSYEDHLSVPALVQMLVAAERDDVDAVIIGCYDDPGIDALRELAQRTVVVGPAASAMHLAATIGTRFGIITVPEPASIRRYINANRLDQQLAGIGVIRSSVLTLADDVARTRADVRAAGERLIADGADVLVLGCMSLAFLDFDTELSAELGAPVINPAKVALATAELLVRTGLAPSKLAYPTPTKMRGTTSLAEFVA
jgi:allantoin racemase